MTWYVAWLLTVRGEWLAVSRGPSWWQATVNAIMETHQVRCLDRIVLPSGTQPQGRSEMPP